MSEKFFKNSSDIFLCSIVIYMETQKTAVQRTSKAKMFQK